MNIAHPGVVTRPWPAETMFCHHALNTNSVGLLQEGDDDNDDDVDDGAELLLVELLELLQALLVHCPGLAAVEQSGNVNRLVDHVFGGSAGVFVLKTLL